MQMISWTMEGWLKANPNGQMEADGNDHIITHDDCDWENVYLTGNKDGSITLVGSGNGDLYRNGDGKGYACRGGSGKGDALRGGSGKGDAYRSDEGEGDACREGSGNGNAWRTGSGYGKAGRYGKGNGYTYQNDNGVLVKQDSSLETPVTQSTNSLQELLVSACTMLDGHSETFVINPALKAWWETNKP